MQRLDSDHTYTQEFRKFFVVLEAIANSSLFKTLDSASNKYKNKTLNLQQYVR